MTLSKYLKPTVLFSVRENHIINKSSFVFKKRSSFSPVYLKSSITISAEQSSFTDVLWYALQSARLSANAVRYVTEVPLRIGWGDIEEASDAETKLSRIGLMCAQLANNLKVSSIAIFLLQLATEFGYTVIDLVKRLIALFTDWNLCPSQLFQDMRGSLLSFLVRWGIIGDDGEVAADPISNVIEAEQSLLGMDIEMDEAQITAVAGIMGGLAVILAAGFAGFTDYSPHKGFLKSIAEFGSKAAKMKNGLYAILTCIKDFSAFVKECMLNYFGSKPADSVVRAIGSLNLTMNGEPVKVDELFDMLTKLNTQEGEEEMSANLESYNKGVAICGVFSKVVSGQLSDAFSIPSGTVGLLSQTLRTFEQRVKSAGVKQNMGTVRFTPFCIWIAGPPGCGKSVTMAGIVRILMNRLLKMDAEKFEVPAESNWCHSANFTQEYHTGYNGQYVFQVDDMCQDAVGTLKTSSALQFIQWVSSIPANVTQAALEDKKCPFRSKVLLCSSNEMYPNRQFEIVSNDAFLRRRNLLIEASVSDVNDPYLHWPIKFALRDPLNQSAPAIPFAHFFELMDHIVKNYVVHFDKQTKLVNSIRNGNADDYMDYLAKQEAARVITAEQSADLPKRNICVDNDCPCVTAQPPRPPQPRPFFDPDPEIEYYLNNPHIDEEQWNWRDPNSPIVRVVGTMPPEDWFAQTQLLEENQHRYNLMQTVVAQILMPVYHFRDGVLCDPEEAQLTFTKVDALRVARLRSWFYADITVRSSWQYVFDHMEQAEEEVNAEQTMWPFDKPTIDVAEWWNGNEEQDMRSPWDRFVDECKESATNLSAYWSRFEGKLWWKVLAGLGGAVAAYLAYRYFKTSSGSWRDIVEAEASYDHTVGRGKPIARSAGVQSYNHEIGRSKARVHTVNAVKSSFVQSTFHKNMIELRSPNGSLNGMFIKGTTLLTCHHYFCSMPEGAKFTIVRYPKYHLPVETEHSFDPKRMVKIPGAEDAVLYHVGKDIDSFRDISTKFCDGAMPDTMEAAVTSVFPEQEIVVGQVRTFAENQEVTYYKGVRKSDKGRDDREIARMVKGFNFPGHYRRGKSGSPLIADERVNRAPVIFGIQTSLNEGLETSYFECITKSQIQQALGKIDAVQSMFEEADDRWEQEDDEAWFDAPESLQEICGKSLEFIGPAKRMVHQATDTSLRRSPLYPFFAPMEGTKMFAPAVLRDREVDVLSKSMAGYSRKYGVVDPRILKSVLEQFIMEDRDVRKGGIKKLLTDDEVLNGIHGQGLKGLTLNSSPGLPLVHEMAPGKAGKKTWITMGEDDQRTMCPEMWKKFNEAEADLRRGKMISLTSYACLKDELRTEEKVAAKKTRSFIVLPLIFNMMIRKYFGQWIACQHRLAGQISSAVGIDANSDWTDLKRRLCAMGSDIEDFDYTDWDRSLHPEWFGAYSERVSAWYGDKRGSPEWMVRELLMRQLVFMNIQVGGWLLRTNGGNKSGCAITAEVNTDIHDMLTYYVWNKICLQTGRSGVRSLTHFRERVALALYGDDMLKATRADVTPWFNGTAMKAVIEELGMHITPGDKDETKGFRIRSIDEVTFLKRRFISFESDCGRVRAPLDKSVIQRMVLWIHKSDSAVDATAMNVQGALREAFFWGEDFFQDFTERCQTAWNESKCARVPFPQVHYQSVDDAWKAGMGDLIPVMWQFRVVAGSPTDPTEEL